jgi:hypothetical protein
MVGDRVFGRVSPQQIKEIVEEYEDEEESKTA